MGVIQNAINQALGTAGIAARLSPGLEKRQELHNLRKQEESLKARRDAAVESLQVRQKESAVDLKTMEQDIDILQGTASDVEQLRKRQFELKPSPESYEKYIKSKDVVRRSKSLGQEVQDLLAERQKQAMQEVAIKQETQLKQKRNFMSYLKDQPTSIGGKVGDLDPVLQEKIYQQLAQQKEKKNGTK